jgi:hypothetical protein
MRARYAGLGAIATAGVFLQCSLTVDTDGLTGGPTEAGPHSHSDAPSTIPEGGIADAPGSSDAPTDGPAAPGALGPLWLAYGTTAGKVAVRPWNAGANAWSAELAGPNANDAAAVHWVIPKETPVGSFLAILSQGASASKLDVFQRGPDGAWMLGFSQPMTKADWRSFDIEYETNAKGVIVAYADATSHAKARRFSAGAWSNEVDVGAGGSLSPRWLELARSPISDEITLVYSDDGNNLLTARWDGGKWLKPEFLEGDLNTIGWKCFDAAYENSTGKLVIAWGQLTPIDGGSDRSLRYVTRQPGALTFGAKQNTMQDTPPGPMVLVPEIGTKRLLVSYVEYLCNRDHKGCDDFGAGVWDGDKFDIVKVDLNTTTLYEDRPALALAAGAWLGATGHAVTAYHKTLDGNPGQLAYSYFTSGWSAPGGANAPPSIEARASLQLASVPGSKAVAVVEDTTGTLWSKVFTEDNGGTWADAAGGNPLATALVPMNGVPFAITVP